MNSYIKQGDCLELMKEIPDGSVDLILCDLPYGTTQNSWDYIIPFDKLWEQYNRIIKDNSAILLFSQGLFYVDLVNSNRKDFKYDIVWDKQLISGFLNANKMPLRQHEQIAVFYKHQPTYNPQKHIGNPTHGKGSKYKTSQHKNQNYGKFELLGDTKKDDIEKLPISIVSYQKPHPSKAVHPTQKPVSLLQYLIKTYTNENETVLDNCMGSGSTGVACIETNRKYIGFELEENYFNIAKERIEKAEETQKQKLF